MTPPPGHVLAYGERRKGAEKTCGRPRMPSISSGRRWRATSRSADITFPTAGGNGTRKQRCLLHRSCCGLEWQLPGKRRPSASHFLAPQIIRSASFQGCSISKPFTSRWRFDRCWRNGLAFRRTSTTMATCSPTARPPPVSAVRQRTPGAGPPSQALPQPVRDHGYRAGRRDRAEWRAVARR